MSEQQIETLRFSNARIRQFQCEKSFNFTRNMRCGSSVSLLLKKCISLRSRLSSRGGNQSFFSGKAAAQEECCMTHTAAHLICEAMNTYRVFQGNATSKTVYCIQKRTEKLFHMVCRIMMTLLRFGGIWPYTASMQRTVEDSMREIIECFLSPIFFLLYDLEPDALLIESITRKDQICK